MFQSIQNDSKVAVTRSLIESGAIRFHMSPSGHPVSLNFRPRDAASRGGPLTSELAARVAMVMSNASEDLCKDCQAVVGLHYGVYPQKWADEGSPLVIGFAKACRSALRPFGFHQIQKTAFCGEACRVLVLDTYLGTNPDPMEEALETFCGTSVQVAGVMTFVGQGESKISVDHGYKKNEYPWLSAFDTPRSLLEFCWKNALVPEDREGFVKYHLRLH